MHIAGSLQWLPECCVAPHACPFKLLCNDTQAAKRVQAQHRLVLSGTPIQNNVLELWSLFDFLMPGLC